MWLSRFPVAVLLAARTHATLFQPQIPSVQSFYPDELAQVFILGPETRIFVDEAFVHSNDSQSDGVTLLDFADTFRSDLIEMTSFILPPVQVIPFSQTLSIDAEGPTIILTLNLSSSHTLYSGSPTPEGYDFHISNSSYVISGSGPIGVWWGTRTLLQQLALSEQEHNGMYTIQAGHGADTPGWEVRGFMLDAGRHWYTTEFLAEICTYASFFKINEFHLHASDNLWIPSVLYGPDWRSLYSGFRFEPPQGSPVFGLVPHRNESWNFTRFVDLQSHCARHGVTIVPEIDTPGHSLVISQWRPQLMQKGKPDLLNLSHPETIPTVQSIWSQFLPWFSSAEVSIGADEYLSSLADEYISFVNEMSSYIGEISGKSMRVWGAHEPSSTFSISTNVTIQHWDFPSASIPVDLLDSGYRVVNSEHAFLYLEGKVPAESGFPQTLNVSLFFGAGMEGGGWAPNIFSAGDPSNNTAYSHPGLRGAIFALWNDWGSNATTPLETYYQLSQSLAVFAEKTWAGSGIRSSELTMDQFDKLYPQLNVRAPGQNLNHAVKGKKAGDIVFAYERITLFPFHTGVASVGPPYTLSFTVRARARDVQTTDDITAAVQLFSGTDSTLYASSLTLSSNEAYYPLPPAFQLRPGVWTNVTIQATREYTCATVVQEGYAQTYWYETTLNIWGDYVTQANMSFAAPSATIGSKGFGGELANIVLRID